MKNFKNLKNFKLIMLFFYIAVITSWVIYEIFITLRFKPEEDYMLDLWYFIGFGLIILPIFIKKIFIFNKNKVLKIFLSFLSILVVATLTISIWAFSPHYLTKSFRNGLFSTKEEKFFYGKLKELSNLEGKVGSLKEWTNFEWDEITIKTPYSPSEESSYIKFYKDKKLVKVINAYQKLFSENIINDNKSFIQFSKNYEKESSSIVEFEIEIEKFSDHSVINQSKIYTLKIFTKIY